MKNKAQKLTLTLIAFLIVSIGSAARGEFEINWYTIDGGGGMFAYGGDFEMSGTIGQPDAGEVMTSSSFEVVGGFWALEQLPPSIIHGQGLTGQTRPHSGFLDARVESTDGSSLDLGMISTRVLFNVPVFGTADGEPVTTAAFTLTETGDDPAPNIVSVTHLNGIDERLYEVTWDRPVTLQEWTTLAADVYSADGLRILDLGDLGPGADEPDRVDLAFLPCDIDQNATISPFDLLLFRQYVNELATPEKGAVEDYIDTNRDESVTPFDLLVFRQLINGVTPPATRPWAGSNMNHPRP